jgi:hypothetical protein
VIIDFGFSDKDLGSPFEGSSVRFIIYNILL